MRLPKSAGAIPQIKTGRRKAILLAAEQLRMIKTFGSAHRRRLVGKNADLADACRQGRGHGRRRPEHIKNDHGAIENLRFGQICGSEDDINLQRRSHMPA